MTLWAYGAAVALRYVYVALPGGWHYRDPGGYAFWLVVDAVIVIFLIRGSRMAWGFGIVFGVLGLLTVFGFWIFASSGFDPDAVVATVIALVELALLLAPSTRGYVGSAGRGKPALAT